MRKQNIMKKILRKEFVSQRNNLLLSEIEKKSAAIKKSLFNMPEFIRAELILFYVSTGSEVDTHQMIRETLKMKKRVAVPISLSKEARLIISEIKDFDSDLEVGYSGILEPKSFCHLIDYCEVDLIVVPGIVFDENGYRVGYGGGYYDRLLKEMIGKVTIGLAYELQITKAIPYETHDRTVEVIITERRIIESMNIISLLKATGGLIEGHFLLSSGRHSLRYCQCAKLLQYPPYSEFLARRLARRLKNFSIDLITAPALGGLIIGYEVAKAMKTPFLFAERAVNSGKMEFRRSFKIMPHEKVIVIEDVFTTGRSTSEVIELVQNSGGIVVGVGVLIDRSNGMVNIGLPIEALVSIDIPSYPVQDCPGCKGNSLLVKPGSRHQEVCNDNHSRNGSEGVNMECGIPKSNWFWEI